MLLCRDHFAWQLQEFVCLGSTFSWQAQYFWSIRLRETCWNSEVKRLLNMSFLKEVSQTGCVFDLQSFIFEGSLANRLCFWSSKLHFWRKSRTKASFLSFKASFLKEVSHKSFVFELQSFIFERSLTQKLRFLSFQVWILKEVSQKSFVLELQSFIFEGSLAEKEISDLIESQISWQPNHLNPKSFDNQINWISNQLTTSSLESQSTDNQNHLNHTSAGNQITWTPNQLTTKVIWISNQMTPKSLDSQLVWIWHQLTFEPIELHTPSSYRFLMFGNFRHRLVR